MTSLLSGLMKISGKLPLASTADTVLPLATAKRGRFGRGSEGGRVGGGGCSEMSEGGGGKRTRGLLAPASKREILREFPRLISPALCARGRRASLISDVNC